VIYLGGKRDLRRLKGVRYRECYLEEKYALSHEDIQTRERSENERENER
jgi:hypothetical protein